MRPDTSDPEDAYEHCGAHRLDNHTAFLLGLRAFHPPQPPHYPDIPMTLSQRCTIFAVLFTGA